MKDVTYYSDITGEEITDGFASLAVDLKFSQTWSRPTEVHKKTIHLAGEDHPFDTAGVELTEYCAYVSESGTVAMIEESDGPQRKYHGRDTELTAVAELFDVLDSYLDTKSGGSDER